MGRSDAARVHPAKARRVGDVAGEETLVAQDVTSLPPKVELAASLIRDVVASAAFLATAVNGTGFLSFSCNNGLVKHVAHADSKPNLPVLATPGLSKH